MRILYLQKSRNKNITAYQAEITNLEWNVNKNNPYSVIRITANSTMYNL